MYKTYLIIRYYNAKRLSIQDSSLPVHLVLHPGIEPGFGAWRGASEPLPALYSTVYSTVH